MEALYQAVYAHIYSLTFSRLMDDGEFTHEAVRIATERAQTGAALAVANYSFDDEREALVAKGKQE